MSEIIELDLLIRDKAAHARPLGYVSCGKVIGVSLPGESLLRAHDMGVGEVGLRHTIRVLKLVGEGIYQSFERHDTSLPPSKDGPTGDCFNCHSLVYEGMSWPMDGHLFAGTDGDISPSSEDIHVRDTSTLVEGTPYSVLVQGKYRHSGFGLEARNRMLDRNGFREPLCVGSTARRLYEYGNKNGGGVLMQLGAPSPSIRVAKNT